MGKLYIVRHGETQWNAEGRVQGHTDISMSDKGRQQAQTLARRLAMVHFNAAYSSDLSRCTETARIILGESPVPLHTTPRLREYNKGVFEGLTVHEYGARYPDQFRASLVNDLDFAPTGGESMRQTSQRMAGFVEYLQEQHPEDTVLVVGHGGSLRSLLVGLLSLPLEANWKFVMGNCALSIVCTYPDNAVLHLYNDTSHLDGLRTEA
jgi:broad specificity phosphatase PhoE